MTDARQDFLSECNTVDLGPKLTEDEFGLAFCSRCVNKECQRSLTGDAYELRTSGWEKRLFLDVPRTEPNDPRYEGIRAQKFIDTQPALGSISLVNPQWEAPKGVSALPLVRANTPYQGPQTLPGGQITPSVPTTEGQVVRPGARIKLGVK